MTDDAIGREVDGYRIEEVLGRGGMGVVYKATDVALSRPVALKRINPSQSHREAFLHRFRSEAKALARINSPHIVGIYALRETEIGLLIVMEYVAGGTVADRICEGPLSIHQALPYLRQMLSAFEDAHAAGVIHRDIKPQNLLCTEHDVVKVTDFGIAKMRRQDSGETVTQGGQGGTLKYMSPEQISDVKSVDNRSDIYSIGMTAYRMLAGGLPFEATDTDFDIMRKVVEGRIPSPKELNPSLADPIERWLIKATQKQPADRYQTAEAMCEALEEAAAQVQSGQSGDGTPPPSSDAALSGDVSLDEAPTVMEDAPTQPTVSSEADPPGPMEGATQIAVDETVPSIEESPSLDEDSSDDTPGEAVSPPTDAPASSEPEEQASADRPARDPAAHDASSSSSSTPMAVAAAVVVLLLAAGGYWMMQPSASPPEMAHLSLQTRPAGAAVLVDEDTVGTTPLREEPLPAGAINLRLVKDGYAPVDTTLRIESGTNYRIGPYPLQNARSNGSPALADSDGGAADQEQTPTEATTADDAPPVTNEAPGSSAQENTPADAPPDEPQAQSPSAQPSAQPPPEPSASENRAPQVGILSVDAAPAVTVLIDGTPQDASRQFRIPPGTRTVACRHPDYGSIETTRTIAAGTVETVSCYFEQPVSVSTTGPWGNVWLNGENTKRRTGTGDSNFRLPPGEHTIGLPIARTGVRTEGGAYRVRQADGRTKQETFTGTTMTIRVEPGFSEQRHAIVFRVVETSE